MTENMFIERNQKDYNLKSAILYSNYYREAWYLGMRFGAKGLCTFVTCLVMIFSRNSTITLEDCEKYLI